MSMKNILTTIVVAASVGWLSAGSCHVSYCDEDCDPCFQQCRCKTSVCYQGSASFQAAHALVVFERVEHVEADGSVQRQFTDIMGLSARRGGSPQSLTVDDVVRFGRGVLAVNAGLFGRDAAEFVLSHTERCESGVFLQFQREIHGSATDLVTLFFDPHGNLVEISHDTRR